MIQYKIGNIFAEDVEAIVNTVNCVGVMGKGLALQFKKRYPENFKSYAFACKKGKIKPGQIHIFPVKGRGTLRFIFNFPTKRHWRNKSKLEDIQIGLKSLVSIIQQLDIHSIAIPPLGCGLGGLDWNIVRTQIEHYLQHLDNVDIIVFEPKFRQLPRPEGWSL